MMTKIIAITSDEDADFIQVEETIFRPQGGGQPGDQGFIIKDDQKYEVLDTIKKEDIILHQLAHDHDLEVDDEVQLEIDFKRRKILTRMHTGEHILFKSLEKKIRSLKLNKISLDTHESGILVSAPEVDFKKVLEAEKLANSIIKQDRKIKEHTVAKEEVFEKFPSIRIKEERIESDTVRVLEIKDFDVSACAGTHLESTGEVGNLLVTKILSQGRSFFEIKFKIDVEQDLFHLADIARFVQGTMGVPYDTLIESLQNLKQENEDLKSQINKLSKGVKVEVKREHIGDLALLYAVFPGITKNQFIKKINEIEAKKTLCVFLNEARNKCHIAIRVSQDLPHKANDILEKLLKEIPGKGGGNKDLAQGSIESTDTETIIKKIKKVVS